MIRRPQTGLFSAATLATVVLASAPVAALPTPSKTSRHQSVEAREADVAGVAVILDSGLEQALAYHGLAPEEVHSRLARLSPEELKVLSTRLEQLQAAGVDVPRYIWILLAVFLGVLILGAL